MSLKQWKYTNGYEPYETLPEVNSEDNGKVVGVSDGGYALVSQPPIPTPESTDNGKVLGVSEGQYALVNGGGGGGSGLIVHMTWDAHAEVSVLDKTWQEVWDAFSSGSSVVIADTELEGYARAFAVTIVTEEGHDIVAGSGGATSYYAAESAEGYPHSYDPEA